MEAASNTEAEQENRTKLRGMTKEASGGCLADLGREHGWGPVESPWSLLSVSSLFLSLSVFCSLSRSLLF